MPQVEIETQLSTIEKTQQDIILKLDTIQTSLNTLLNTRNNPFQSSLDVFPISGRLSTINRKKNTQIKK